MSRLPGRPIFIIGSPRSGTTLLRLLLDSHPNISCGSETHFLTQMERIVGHNWYSIELFQFDKAYWHRKIAEFFDTFQSDYALSRGKHRWAEKTPQYTLRVEFINHLFPDCQFIHMIRDGRDVVTSHRDRWGFRSALASINAWRTYVQTAQCFGRSLPDDRYHELRYEALVDQPEAVMRRAFEYLHEPWVPEVLEYDQAAHDLGPRHARHTATRRANSGDTSLIYQSRVGAGHRELEPLLSFLFHVKNGKLLRKLGYR